MDRSNNYRLFVRQNDIALEHTYSYYEAAKEQPRDVLHKILVRLGWEWDVTGYDTLSYFCNKVVNNRITLANLELEFVPKSPDDECCFKCIVFYNSKYICTHSLLAANTNSKLRNDCRDVEAILSDWEFVKVVLGVIGLNVEIIYE